MKGAICLADLNRRSGKVDEAYAMLMDIARSDPDNFNAFYHLGQVLEEQKKSREAMDYYKKAFLVYRSIDFANGVKAVLPRLCSLAEKLGYYEDKEIYERAVHILNKEDNK